MLLEASYDTLVIRPTSQRSAIHADTLLLKAAYKTRDAAISITLCAWKSTWSKPRVISENLALLWRSLDSVYLVGAAMANDRWVDDEGRVERDDWMIARSDIVHKWDESNRVRLELRLAGSKSGPGRHGRRISCWYRFEHREYVSTEYHQEVSDSSSQIIQWIRVVCWRTVILEAVWKLGFWIHVLCKGHRTKTVCLS